ncbi:MAG: molybdopterin-dependent oxidoreductase [Candidatus Nitrohelix vancouverensis]|uniref:Molybdopterin-dependent oxidoreductase n=1 Tax=Candidatus Nitrohelix vancouverensis TaxID=2705534 RepID=A0A7T0C2L4_9BACT|nr:MAG: molybdopterin-dependent oxidoreductase [Candidatus Nitrohelix vancouverensis]
MQLTRKQFLKSLLADFALLALAPLKALANMKPRILQTRRETLPVTPVPEFYVEDISGPPKAEVMRSPDWRLKIHGRLSQPLSLSLDEIRAMPSVRQAITLSCIGNPVGGRALGNAYWQGVPLSTLLRKADPDFFSNRLILRADDGYHESVPLKKGFHPGAMIAYSMNDQPLTPDHGMPVRLLIPGLYGIKQVKWLREIEISRGSYQGYWQKKGWTQQARVHIFSRIDFPQNEDALPLRSTEIKGIAFAGDRGIQYVQVSTDGERTWFLAEIEKPLSPYSWVFWSYRWTPHSRGEFDISVRAADQYSGRQENGSRDPFPSGVDGVHRIRVEIL